MGNRPVSSAVTGNSEETSTVNDSRKSAAVAARSGLFDFQVNGFAGVDFQNPKLREDDLLKAVTALRQEGFGGIFLTLITDSVEALEGKLRRLESMRASIPEVAAMIVGYHLEGPYISPEEGYRGAHPQAAVKAPDLSEFERLWEASGGNLRLLTLAPEWPGSADFIEVVAARGVSVSLGHTNATMSEIETSIAAGARFCTHLGNGVPATLPRHDNVVQRLLARDELIACLIPDGIHLPPFVLRNFVRAKPPGRVLMTSDCMAAAGAPPGRYCLGTLEVEAGFDGVVRLPGTRLLAGSAFSFRQAPENLQRWCGLSAREAFALCSSGAARAFDLAWSEPVSSEDSEITHPR